MKKKISFQIYSGLKIKCAGCYSFWLAHKENSLFEEIKGTLSVPLFEFLNTDWYKKYS